MGEHIGELVLFIFSQWAVTNGNNKTLGTFNSTYSKHIFKSDRISQKENEIETWRNIYDS